LQKSGLGRDRIDSGKLGQREKEKEQAGKRGRIEGKEKTAEIMDWVYNEALHNPLRRNPSVGGISSD
jgi:hypothetical protein